MFCTTKEESLMRDLKKMANKQAIDSFISCWLGIKH